MIARVLVDWELGREVWATLRRHKLRVLLTASSVFWAMFMLIVLLGMGAGFQRGVTRDLGALARRSVYAWASPTRLPFAGFPADRAFRFTNADIERLRRLDDVAHVAPRAQLLNQSIRRGTRVGHFGVMGETADLPLLEPIRMHRGRFVNARDVSEQRKVAVLGTDVRRQLFGDEEALGQFVEVSGIVFKVVGELSPFRSGEAGQRLSSAAFIPFTTFQSVYGQASGIALLTVGARNDVPADRVEGAVRRVLAAAHAVDPRDQQAIGTANGAEAFDEIQGLFAAIRGFVWLIGGVTLLTGIVGVSNILAITVKQRTRELGVRRALGATRTSIVMMVVAEAMVLTTMGGSAGLIAGVTALEAAAALLAMVPDSPVVDPGVDVATLLLGQAVLAAVGLLAAFVPARRAAQIRPIEALRSE